MKIGILSPDKYPCRCDQTLLTSEYTPGGERIAVAFGATVIVFDTMTGKLVSSLIDDSAKSDYLNGKFTDQAGVIAIGFVGDGDQIVTTGSRIKYWDVETGNLLRDFEAGPYRVNTLAASSDNKYLVTGDRGEKVNLWDVESGRLLWSADTKHDVRHLVFGPDGKSVLAASRSDFFVWDVRGGNLLYKRRVSGRFSIWFAKDGSYAAIQNTKDKSLGLYRITF